MRQPNYRELMTIPIKDLKKEFKMNDQNLERSIRKHMDGATAQQRTELYKEVYDKKKD